MIGKFNFDLLNDKDQNNTKPEPDNLKDVYPWRRWEKVSGVDLLDITKTFGK